MIRVQVFGSFLAAGVCFGLLAPALTSPSEPGWDSRESKSDLFDQQTSPSASQAVYASTAHPIEVGGKEDFPRRWQVADRFRATDGCRAEPGVVQQELIRTYDVSGRAG